METILIFDFFACFLKIPKRMESPTLKKTMKNYFKTYFFFDMIATCFGAAAFFKTQDMLIVAYFKLARLVRLRDIGSSIYFIVRNSCCRDITT